MSGADFRRRVAAVTVTIAALTAAGAVTPALAATGPSVTVNHGAVIAVQGPKDSLRFYRAIGPTTWHPETVAGAGTTFSAPSVTADGHVVDIAARGPDESLLFYWAVSGTTTWHEETVAGPGSVA